MSYEGGLVVFPSSAAPRPKGAVALATGLLGGALALGVVSVMTPAVGTTAPEPVPVPSVAETVPVGHAGDAMDDPAVWVHPDRPGRSLLLGNDKGGALETYDLDGNRVQRLTNGDFWGNVDVRHQTTIAGVTRDLVGVVSDRLLFFTVEPDARTLRPVTEGGNPIGSAGEGFCLFDNPLSGRVFAFVITRPGVLTQHRLVDVDRDGKLESRSVRSFPVGSETEGCAVDDATGALYVAEEEVALWRYDARPSGGTARREVDGVVKTGGHIAQDAEGVTVVHPPGERGYVIVSAQNAGDPGASYFTVYRAGASNAYVTSFRVVDGQQSDDCDRTDGITATAADLGRSFPRGVFVCQDDDNVDPGTAGNQNLKLVKLPRILALDPRTR